MNKVQEQFVELLNDKNIVVTEQQLNLFNQYFQILVDYNNKVNLTSITDEKDVYIKHFYDSLTLLLEHEIEVGSTICDVGAGAGFPSVPVKILRPDLDITIVDSLGKRIDFLNYLFDELKLSNIKAVHSRAEDFTAEHRESFDYVTARAVARLNVLSELCIPLAKLNGKFIALKAASGDEELKEAEKAIEKLGCKLQNNHKFNLPDDGGERNIIIFNKIKNTPLKYPRNYGQIKKKPL